MVISLGSLFCLIYPRLGAEEASNLEMPMGSAKGKTTKQQQMPAVYSQRAKKEAAWPNRKLLDNNHSMPAKHHRKNCGSPLLTPARAEGGA